MLKNQTLHDAVVAFQTDGFLHPYTCGNGCRRTNLIPLIKDNEMVGMKCEDCDYTQAYYPCDERYLKDRWEFDYFGKLGPKPNDN